MRRPGGQQAVLAAGLALMLAINAAALRNTLSPLDQLAPSPNGSAHFGWANGLVATLNAMLDRLQTTAPAAPRSPWPRRRPNAAASPRNCRTRSGLDETVGRRPEGLVLRNFDRSRIAKARFQDYERTLKRRRRQ